MKRENVLLILVITLVLAFIAVDRLYMSKMEKTFAELEQQRIVTSNKLATAKIVHENLNHVRDLVLKNMDLPGVADSLSHETIFFDFVTTCVNDLKLKLVAVKPLRPTVNGLVTTYGYEIDIEGDFFKFGELCSKFENSRRIISLEEYTVDQISSPAGSGGYRGIRVHMLVNTYRVQKNPGVQAAAAAPVPAAM